MDVIAWFSLAVTTLFAVTWIVELALEELRSDRPEKHHHRVTR